MWYKVGEGVPFATPVSVIKKLEQCYYRNLCKKIAGGYWRACQRIIQHDTYMPSLEVYLQCYTLAQRTRKLAREKPGRVDPTTSYVRPKPPVNYAKVNPFTVLQYKAQVELDRLARWYHNPPKADPELWKNPKS